MTQLPKISIIIPVYNVAEYITECMQSVMRQTYKGQIECILVDDCGTDDSMQIAEQLIADYKGNITFNILHHDHNRGLSAARNTGTEAATGDYIYYLDSDDYITDNCLAVLANPLENKEYDIVVGDYEIVGEDWGIPKLQVNTGEYIGGNVISQYCMGHIYVMSWNKLYNYTFIRNNDLNFKEGMIHEDDYMSFMAFSIAKSLYVVNNITYHYLVRENGIMSNKKYTKRNRDCYAKTLLLIAKYIQKQDNVRPEMYEWLHNPYLKLVTQISLELHLSFYDIYKRLRKSYSYPVIQLFTNNDIKKRKCFIRFHYALVPPIGYLYLIIVCIFLGYDKI